VREIRNGEKKKKKKGMPGEKSAKEGQRDVGNDGEMYFCLFGSGYVLVRK
jgi:hypothetical protein